MKKEVLLDDSHQPFRLRYTPLFLTNPPPRIDEIWVGRVRALDPGGRGCFVDVGAGHQIYLQVKNKKPDLGQKVTVRIKSEAQTEKLANAVLAHIPHSVDRNFEIGLAQKPKEDAFFRNVEIINSESGLDIADSIESAFESIIAEEFEINGGGRVYIQQTKAFCGVDVDSAGKTNKGDRDYLAFEVNKSAVELIVRLISLKAIAGIVVIDFLKMKDQNFRRQVMELLDNGLNLYLGRKCDILGWTRAGHLEVSIARREQSVLDLMKSLGDGDVQLWCLFSEIYRTASADCGALYTVHMSKALDSSLRTSTFDWIMGLYDKIGARVSFHMNNDLDNWESKLERING